jgi:hypothetical protein
MAEVFLSYAREDRQRVEPLVHLLERFGVSVFSDRMVPAGSIWREVLSREATAASCVVVAWSTHSITSDWVLEDGKATAKRRVPIVGQSVQRQSEEPAMIKMRRNGAIASSLVGQPFGGHYRPKPQVHDRPKLRYL